MKSGSTSLEKGLTTHPEIYTPGFEPRFFHGERYREKGIDWYYSLFDGRDENSVGERNGFYAWDSWCDATAEWIGIHVPQAKIMLSNRRIEFHWSWSIANGQPWGDVNDALHSVDRLIEMSLYGLQISQYRKYFPDEQIKVLFLEDLKADPRSFFKACGRFLGVDRTDSISRKPLRQGIERLAAVRIPE